MLFIIWTVIAPVFVILGLGWAVQRAFRLDIKSLVRLNFWIFVPIFLFVRIVDSQLSHGDFLQIILHFAAMFLVMFGLVWWGAKLIGAGDRLRRALTASVLFYNAGNFGLPVVELAFATLGAMPGSVQAIVIMLQNTSNFTIGLALHGGGGGKRRRETLVEVFRLPMIYTLVAAFAWRATGWPLPGPLDKSLHLIADALVPVALITLGAQMAMIESHAWSKALSLSLFLRLIIGPLLAFVLVWLLQIHGPLAQILIVSAAAPTAVNSALVAIEYNNEPDFAAATVFFSTLVAVLTVSLAIWAVAQPDIVNFLQAAPL